MSGVQTLGKLRVTPDEQLDLIKIVTDETAFYMLRYWSHPLGARIATVQEIKLEVHEAAQLIELFLDELESWKSAA